MKSVVAVVSLAVLAVLAAGEDRPQGALLVLPQPFNGAQYNAQQQQEDVNEASERLRERLAQEAGGQRGNYHVYLSDGRLQRVQYAAAPLQQSEQLRQQQASNSQQVSVQNSQSVSNSNVLQFNQQNAQASSGKYVAGEPNPVVGHFGRLQQERLQQQLGQLRQRQEQLKQQAEEVEEQLQQQKEFSANYVATIQYSEVPPIPAPIYSQGPAPLTRILRHLH